MFPPEEAQGENIKSGHPKKKKSGTEKAQKDVAKPKREETGIRDNTTKKKIVEEVEKRDH